MLLERPPEGVVGIEVKAKTTVRPGDFHGLRRLEAAAGDRFACGVLLHHGARIQRTAPRMFAMPFRMLWEA